MEINPYLSFPGTCREAFETYAQVLGGTLEALHTHGETPMADQMPDGWRDKVMHAQLRVGDRVLMGADMPPDWFKQPQGFSVSLNLGDVEAAKRIFARLAEGGTVGMEFQETFWAKGFGMLTDRFGIPWMLNIQPQAAQSV
jgi:PhnB protein